MPRHIHELPLSRQMHLLDAISKRQIEGVREHNINSAAVLRYKQVSEPLKRIFPRPEQKAGKVPDTPFHKKVKQKIKEITPQVDKVIQAINARNERLIVENLEKLVSPENLEYFEELHKTVNAPEFEKPGLEILLKPTVEEIKRLILELKKALNDKDLGEIKRGSLALQSSLITLKHQSGDIIRVDTLLGRLAEHHALASANLPSDHPARDHLDRAMEHGERLRSDIRDINEILRHALNTETLFLHAIAENLTFLLHGERKLLETTTVGGDKIEHGLNTVKAVFQRKLDATQKEFHSYNFIKPDSSELLEVPNIKLDWKPLVMAIKGKPKERIIMRLDNGGPCTGANFFAAVSGFLDKTVETLSDSYTTEAIRIGKDPSDPQFKETFDARVVVKPRFIGIENVPDAAKTFFSYRTGKPISMSGVSDWLNLEFTVSPVREDQREAIEDHLDVLRHYTYHVFKGGKIITRFDDLGDGHFQVRIQAYFPANVEKLEYHAGDEEKPSGPVKPQSERRAPLPPGLQKPKPPQ